MGFKSEFLFCADQSRYMIEIISIQLASPEESSAVADIGRITFYETWREVNTEEDMLLYMKESFHEKKIKEELFDTTNNLFLLTREGDHIIGYAKMRRDRTYDEFKGTKVIEIERIYLRKEFQKKKIGKLLMDRCIELAKAEHNSWLWLAVNTENRNAIDFYTRYGFEVFGTKFFKLGNAEDQDYLMKLSLD